MVGLQVLAPGAYRCVCVKLTLNHLAVNAIIQAGLVGELEGAAVLEDSQGCGPAFRVLKGLAEAALADATKHGNK